MNEQIRIGATWFEMWQRLSVALPRWAIRRMVERSEGKGFAIKAIPFVILFLSVASIANLSNRAFEHHANFSSYMTGAGIAVLVPIAVIAAMIVEGKWSYAFWIMAVAFAGISGTIQYNIYLLPGGGVMGIAEAVAFGYGVPLSEVMLAVMEARLVIQFDRRKAAKLAAQDSETKAQEATERQRIEQARLQSEADQRAAEQRQRQAAIDEENRDFERRRRQAELDAYTAKLAQDAELERERAMLELRIREQKAIAKVAESEPRKVSISGRSIDETSQESVQKVLGESVGKQLVRFYKNNPGALLEDAAKHVGWSVPLVSREISTLVDVGVFHAEKQGRRKVITVNGGHEQYLAS